MTSPPRLAMAVAASSRSRPERRSGAASCAPRVGRFDAPGVGQRRGLGGRRNGQYAPGALPRIGIAWFEGRGGVHGQQRWQVRFHVAAPALGQKLPRPDRAAGQLGGEHVGQ